MIDAHILQRFAEIGIWTSLGVVFYVYLGYPLTLLTLPARPLRPVARPLPPVTVIIAAYNEAEHIESTLQNKLAQDYPPELLDVVVVSDGSTDATDAIVERSLGRVALLRQNVRQGKTIALNRAMSVARGEIIVFSDANSHYDSNAVRALVDAFLDPSVGYVTGSLFYVNPGGDTAVGGGSGLYMRYENWVRRVETRVGSVVGVNGGIDAVRRELYRPMAAGDLPDFVLPLRVVQQGYRVIFCEAARARETALGQQHDEFRMRVRVSLRALHALYNMRALLRPRYARFVFQLWIHKVVRYALFLPLGAAFLLNLALTTHPVYAALLAAQVSCYGLALVGWLSGGRIRARAVFVPFYFCLVNLAAGVALVRFLRGERQIIWTPRKGA
jgi:cellulose synthase/poly-beta-1,6-N-acetylglucosamine synthase-like glycosyltransferase